MSNDTGWHEANSGGITHEAGKKLPNAWGLYDMHGNVCELCWDWYKSQYPSEAQTNPAGPAKGDTRPNGEVIRVMRGATYFFPQDNEFFRSAARGASAPPQKSKAVGFRLVRPE
jgi:formylglycine-generating enzyme required for sulfatase activity